MITPIHAGEILKTLGNMQAESPQNTQKDVFIPFQDLFADAIRQVAETDKAVQSDAIKLAAGDADSLHTMMIDLAKAELAVSTLVQVRNKAFDAYNEIMRITL